MNQVYIINSRRQYCNFLLSVIICILKNLITKSLICLPRYLPFVVLFFGFLKHTHFHLVPFPFIQKNFFEPLVQSMSVSIYLVCCLLSENIYSSSFLKDILVGYINLSQQVFFLKRVKMLFQSLLASIVYDEQSATYPITRPLNMMCHFPLAAWNLFPCLVFSKQFGHLGLTELFESILLSVFKLRNFHPLLLQNFLSHHTVIIISSFSSPLFFLLLQAFNYTLYFLTLFSRSLKTCSPFSLIFSFSDWILFVDVDASSLTSFLCHLDSIVKPVQSVFHSHIVFLCFQNFFLVL